MKYLIGLLPLFFLVLSLNAQDITQESDNSLVIFLVRHAEKVDESADPELSLKGKERAITLAQTLKNSELDYIHSTDYIRTINTVQPTAELFELEINIYDPSDLGSFAEKLLKMNGRHLVSGHSNTTPKLVKLLGGKPGDPIYQPTEYDRLYVLSISKENGVNTVLLKYGDKY